MSARRRFHGAAAVCLLCVLAGFSSATAQSSGGNYALKPHVIAGGGRATGAAFALQGSIGQPDAGTLLSGAAFELTGGFHRRAAGGSSEVLFRNGFE